MTRLDLISIFRKHSLTVQVVTLVFFMLAAYAIVLGVAMQRGPLGVVAASLAAGVCFLSAVTALLMSRCLQGPAGGIAAMLLPTVARTAPPLMLAVVVRLLGRPLVETGFVYYLVGFYLLALAVELPMSLPRIRPTSRCAAGLTGKDRRVHG